VINKNDDDDCNNDDDVNGIVLCLSMSRCLIANLEFYY